VVAILMKECHRLFSPPTAQEIARLDSHIIAKLKRRGKVNYNFMIISRT